MAIMGSEMEKTDKKKKVLFICTHNSARSHIAEGLMRSLHGSRFKVRSSGTHPTEVNPLAIKAMAEIGIDISDHQSNSVEDYLDREWDYVVTVCDRANEACPFFPGGKEKIHRGFEDPAAVKGSEEEKMLAFRRVRDEIKGWIEETF
jgi:arsenate reductase